MSREYDFMKQIDTVIDETIKDLYMRMPEDTFIKACPETAKAVMFDIPSKDIIDLWIPKSQLAQDVHGFPYVTHWWWGKNF